MRAVFDKIDNEITEVEDQEGDILLVEVHGTIH